MHLIHIRGIRLLALHDLDRAADDDVDGAAVGHEADVVVEDATCVEEGDLRGGNEALVTCVNSGLGG